MIELTNIRSLSDFQWNTKDHLRRLKEDEKRDRCVFEVGKGIPKGDWHSQRGQAFPKGTFLISG